MKRGLTKLSGILAINKPAGMTSHDVVNRVRRLSGEGRVGHAGTLDPAATGLLLVCVGPATRLSDLLMHQSKTYEANIVFGAATDTDDADGEIISAAPLSAQLADADYARKLLAGFTGSFMQQPPRFSALKRAGVPAYKLARQGKEPDLAPRQVTIDRLELQELQAEPAGDRNDAISAPGAPSACSWRIAADVSKGTYLRALARDIGEASGCLAHLGALCRTRIGHITLAAAVTLEQLEQASDGQTSGWEQFWLDPLAALALPEVELTPREYGTVCNGGSLSGAADGLANDALVALTCERRVMAIYQARIGGRLLIPQTIIPGGVSGIGA